MLEMRKVHEDERGEIYVIPLGDDKDLVINTTNKGYARGGCYHELNDEFFMVILGVAKMWIGGCVNLYYPGMSTSILKGTPHMMVAQTRCITMEWGSTQAEKGTYYKGFRERVEQINKEKLNGFQDKSG